MITINLQDQSPVLGHWRSPPPLAIGPPRRPRRRLGGTRRPVGWSFQKCVAVGDSILLGFFLP